MSRIDELERYNQINLIMDDLFIKSGELKKELNTVFNDLIELQYTDDHVEEKRILIASRVNSLRDEINMLEAEMKYRNATALWIKKNLPR